MVHKGDFRFTPNQHIIISNIKSADKKQIQDLLVKFNMNNDRLSGIRLSSMACVALPTCGLAFAEAERYLPDLITDLEVILEANGLRDDSIVIRMTGCPNGCARPYMAEIGLVGKAPGFYNLYLGASHSGMRAAKLAKEAIGHDEILSTLKPMIEQWAKKRQEGESFGDFVIRAGFIAGQISYPTITKQNERPPAITFHEHTSIW